jgi:hypothetical protein
MVSAPALTDPRAQPQQQRQRCRHHTEGSGNEVRGSPGKVVLRHFSSSFTRFCTVP